MQFPLLRKLFPPLYQANLQSPLKFRLLLAAPHTAGWPPGRSAWARSIRAGPPRWLPVSRNRRSGNVLGPEIPHKHTCAHPHAEPFAAKKRGPRGSHPPACRPTWQGACTHSDPPQPQTTRIRAHRHTAAVAHARSATRKPPFSATHAQARGEAGQLPARRPPGKRRTLRARAAPSPRPPPGRARGGGARWGRVLRHRPGSCARLGGPRHILLLLLVQAGGAGPGPNRGLRGRGRSGARSHGAPDGHPR